MVKTVSVTVTVLALLALGVWMLPGTDQEGISGTWRLRVRLGDSGGRTGSLMLIQDGETLTGTYTGPPPVRTAAGGWDYGSAELTGTVTGETVEFSFPVQEGNRITYTGTIQDRTISGTCDYGPAGGPGTWDATRQQSAAWDF